MSPRDEDEAKAIASELVLLKNRLGRIGMYKTMQAMDGLAGTLAYELAELMPKKKPKIAFSPSGSNTCCM